tara:strand:- start:619 stop:1905 length:1287 start_codon:yes stop_codon:yes gene_type:complete
MLHRAEGEFTFNLLSTKTRLHPSKIKDLLAAPQLVEILNVMVLAKLLANDVRLNTKLCEALHAVAGNLPVCGISIIRSHPPRSPIVSHHENKYAFNHGHNLDNIVRVYKLLLGNDASPCVLTAEIHIALLERIRNSWTRLEMYRDLFEKMSALGALKSDTTLIALSQSVMRLQQVTDSFDPTGAAMVYALEQAKDNRHILRLNNIFKVRGGGETVHPSDSYLYGERPWLTTESFKLMVDHIEHSELVINAFLQQSLDEKFYKKTDRFGELPAIIKSLFMLHNVPDLIPGQKQIHPGLVKLVFANPEAGEAIAFLIALEGYQSFGAIEERKDLIFAVCMCRDLTAALIGMRQLYQQLVSDNRYPAAEQRQLDLLNVIQGVLVNKQPLAGKSARLFSLESKQMAPVVLEKLREQYYLPEVIETSAKSINH